MVVFAVSACWRSAGDIGPSRFGRQTSNYQSHGLEIPALLHQELS